jgi:hypothetical protein
MHVGMAPAQAIPAFSGAEGWGAVTPGGRGGSVIHVTNLNDSGPGSFREAVTAAGPRTVVFDVAGQINLLSEVSIANPYLTIAGQTAPGGGITIAGETTSLDTHDIVVRHIRLRRGLVDENRRDDALGSDRTTGNIIIDHVSASWGLDENMSVYRNKLDAPIVPGGSTVLPTRNVTIQWSISSEALNPFQHAFGSTLGGAGVNFHHNLWASNTGRNPSISFSNFMDFRNNVLFNWMHRSVDGAGPEAHVNMINNYYRPGPATGFSNGVTPQPIPELKVLIVEPEIRQGVFPGGVGWWYVDGNVVDGYPEVTADNWEGLSQVAPGVFARGVQFEQSFPIEWARQLTPHTHVEFPDDPDDPEDDDGMGNVIPIPDLPKIATQSAGDAHQAVLTGAGASLARDAVDLRVIQSAQSGVATAGPRGDGIITDISQVGGFPAIPFVERTDDYDLDQDGMPDQWESDHGLSAANADDRNGDFDADGFTNLEEYLDEEGAFQAVEDVVWDGGNGRYALIDNWNITFQPSRFDTAVIDNATVTVDAIGQHAGTVKIGQNAVGGYTELNVSGGWLRVADEVQIGSASPVSVRLRLSGGELSTHRLSKTNTAKFTFSGGELHADLVDFSFANEGGTIAPGDGIGVTSVMGDLALNGGALEIEIGGAGGNEYDRLEVQGLTTLGGTLRVQLVDLGQGIYQPQLGDAFAFLAAYGGAIDMFDAFDLPELGAGLEWAIAPGDVALFLAVVSAPLAGDYNNDGHVNSADYTVWRNSLGSNVGLPNETASPNVVDEADYAVWKANFGTSRGDGAASQVAVPEPAALVSLIAGGMVLVLLRSRTARARSESWCYTR